MACFGSPTKKSARGLSAERSLFGISRKSFLKMANCTGSVSWNSSISTPL